MMPYREVQAQRRMHDSTAWDGLFSLTLIGGFILLVLLCFSGGTSNSDHPGSLGEWEQVAPKIGDRWLYRTAVPGGWIYVFGGDAIFVPDAHAGQEAPR